MKNRHPLRDAMPAVIALSAGIVLVLAVWIPGSRRFESARSAHPPQQQAAQVDTIEPKGTLQTRAIPIGAKLHDIEVDTSKTVPDFEQEKLTAKPGELVRLTFRNSSTVADQVHTWVLVKPGATEKVAEQGERAGSKNDWVKPAPEVLATTGKVAPGESKTIVFRAPDKPGDYPYICTFPGHHEGMHGVLRVKG